MHLCSKEATRHHITCVSNVPYTISFPKANRPSLYFLDASSLYSDSLTNIALLIKSFHQTGIRLQLLQFIHAYLSLLSLCDKSCQWIDITMSERGQFGQGGGIQSRVKLFLLSSENWAYTFRNRLIGCTWAGQVAWLHWGWTCSNMQKYFFTSLYSYYSITSGVKIWYAFVTTSDLNAENLLMG